MTNALIVIGVIMILAIVGFAAWRSTQTDVIRRRDFLRMKREHHATRLTLHMINRKVAAYRPSLDEAGLALADEINTLLDDLDRKILEENK